MEEWSINSAELFAPARPTPISSRESETGREGFPATAARARGGTKDKVRFLATVEERFVSTPMDTYPYITSFALLSALHLLGQLSFEHWAH